MHFLYHPRRRLVQLIEEVPVKLYRGRRSAYVKVLPRAREEIFDRNCNSGRLGGRVDPSLVR